jgi:release factor glutamine methyltransferase
MTDELIRELPPKTGTGKFADRWIERLLHLLGYYTILRRSGTRKVRADGFDLTVSSTVYDPRYHRAPLYFAEFVSRLDLTGKVVADLCTGSGIQALAACRAGARKVIALDINPQAALTAGINARANRFQNRIAPVGSNLFSATAARPTFDVILTNPPFCSGRAWDIADRAWRAGSGYSDIEALFAQASERLRPGGVMYMILSSLSDLELLGSFIRQAGLSARIASQRRVLLETLIIYELRQVRRTIIEPDRVELAHGG